MCYIVPVYEAALKEVTEVKEYKLPDNRVIKLEQELLKCGEALFQPELAQID